MAILDSPSKVQKAVAQAIEKLIPQFELKLESGEDSLAVVQLAAQERMSEPFEITLTATSPNDGLDLAAIVGKGAGLVVRRGLTHRVWTGVCSHIEQVQPETSQTGLSTYMLRIVPDLWLLQQRSGHRIFQHLSVPDIVEKLLAEWKIEAQWKLDRASYPKLEYRVQYGESDFAFVSRLLEDAGIAYYFTEKTVGDTKAKTQLVFCDKPEKNDPRDEGSLPYVDNPNDAARLPYVTEVRIAHRIRPGRATLRDYDFRRPGFGLFGAAEPAPSPEDGLEQYHYLPGGSLVEVDKVQDKTPVADDRSKARHDDAALKERAQRVLEGDRHKKRHVELASNALDLGPGVVFGVDGHPHADLGKDKKLLVVETMIQGSPTGEWTLVGEAVLADAPYRPDRVTPRPRIDGPQSAIVVGPKGQEIHTDEFGRVRVRFHWDREGLFDDSATCWLRVSQGWAGAGFGMMNIPRVGHEVLVEFLDGDPDQPLVIGRLYNSSAKPPYVLPAHKTRSTWKSNSSPHADHSFNEVMFEDKSKAELVFMQGQKNWRKLVKRHETERTGKDRTRIVGEQRVTAVGAVDSFQIGKQRLVKIVEATDLKIRKMGEPEVSPKETWIEVVDKKITLTTGKASIVLDGPNIVIEANGGVRLSADGELTMQGSKVYFNCLPGQEVTPDADKIVSDRVARPNGRVLASIDKLFYDKPKVDEIKRKDLLVDLPKPGGPVLDSIKGWLGLGKKKPEAPKADGPKVLTVPHRTQTGPTCGLAALGMVMDYHKLSNPNAQTPNQDELLATAKKNGWTDTGGMWERDEAKLAQAYGYDASYTPNATMADLKQSVAEGVPPLVTFSVDGKGDPQKGTDRGHYAVIKGFMEKDGKEYVVAEHGWGGADNKVWEASKFEESWKTLNHGSSPMVKVKGVK